jgi:hypothetical protein
MTHSATVTDAPTTRNLLFGLFLVRQSHVAIRDTRQVARAERPVRNLAEWQIISLRLSVHNQETTRETLKGL